MRTNLIREKWARDDCVLNGWLAVPNGFSAEVMAHQGYDALTVDLQHGVNDEANLIPMPLRQSVQLIRCRLFVCLGLRLESS